MVAEIVFRVLGMLAFAFGGWRLGIWLGGTGAVWQWVLLGVGAAWGIWATPYFTLVPFRWFRQLVSHLHISALVAALIGLFIALIFSGLLTIPVSRLPDPEGKILPLVFTCLLSILGIWIFSLRGKELLQLFGLRWAASGDREKMMESTDKRNLVDTSAIIDGRIADISSSGFLKGTLLIPKFVLEELRHVADSSDPIRRNRGRRGLEMLNRLQKEAAVPIQILDRDVEGCEDVDDKLVMLARDLNSSIITTDFNLNRVAELQGVMVLNINKLANALRPVLLPGEELQVRIIQEGKEFGQGVGFLDDGTMVVVEGGRRYLNNRVDTVVTRVLQTAAGRMVFAQLKNGTGHDRGER